MLAPLLALAASLFWGSGDLLAGLAGRKASSWSVTLVGHLVGLVTGLALLLAVGRPWPGLSAMVPAFAAGVALAFGAVAYFAALAMGTMSMVAPIASAGATVPIVIGLSRGEQPSALQTLGVVAAVVGVGLAVNGRKRRPLVAGTVEVGASVPPRPPTSEGPQSRLGTGLAVVAAALFGVTLVGFSEAARSDPFWTAVSGRMTSVAVLLVLVSLLRGRSAWFGAVRGAPGGGRTPQTTGADGEAASGRGRVGYGLPPGARLKATAAGLFHLTAATFFAIASTRGLLSLVSVLSSLAAVFTVGLAFLFLGERLERLQSIGVVVALAGVVAIAGG